MATRKPPRDKKGHFKKWGSAVGRSMTAQKRRRAHYAKWGAAVGRSMAAQKRGGAARRKSPGKKKAASRARRTPPRNKLGRFLKGGSAAAARRSSSRAYSSSYVKRGRSRKGVRKHLYARAPIGKKQRVAGLVVLNPRTGAIMPYTKVANPRKRRRKNPSRRHHHRRSTARRAHNPSFNGVINTVKSSIAPMVLGCGAGIGAGYIDAKFLGTKPIVSMIVKIAAALAGAAALGKRHPMMAAGWSGGMLGASGYHAGVAIGGGMVGLSPAGALKGIADMAADDPEMGAMIAGLGDVTDDNSGGALGDAAEDYNAALGDVVNEFGDVVEAD